MLHSSSVPNDTAASQPPAPQPEPGTVQAQVAAFDADTDKAFERLEQAVRSGDAAFITAALDRGVSPDMKTRRGDPLLTLASYSGQAELTRLLLARGADPEATNAKGHTALAGVAFTGDVDMIELLVAHGARVDGPCADGKTPLMFAEAFGREAAAARLRALGA